MDKDQLNEVFQGTVNDKFDTVIGKMVEKDGKYMFEGITLNKRGQAIASVTYVAGACTIVYLAAKAGATIGEKIADKIHQRKLRKLKAQAYDEMVVVLEEKMEELKQSEGKHAKDEESE